MKNLKSLQAVALAGVAIAFTSGCSSTGSMSDSSSSDSNSAYRFASSGGWVPITDVRRQALFPHGWTPGQFGAVSYETYMIAPPVADAAADTTVASADAQQFSESLQPGDTFVEAAGADSGQVKRVILYSPFGSAGLGH